MNLLAGQLRVGQTLHINDWHLLIDGIDRDGDNVIVHTHSGLVLHPAADEPADIDEEQP